MSMKSDERYDLWDEMHKIKQDPVLYTPDLALYFIQYIILYGNFISLESS